jgi:hypothetical protein
MFAALRVFLPEDCLFNLSASFSILNHGGNIASVELQVPGIVLNDLNGAQRLNVLNEPRY